MALKKLISVLSPAKALVLACSFSILCLCAAVKTYAAENCSDPQTQIEINMCAAQRYEAADAELNAVYKKALSKIKQTQPEKIESFKAVQRSWIKFRDLQCNILIWLRILFL